MERSWRHYRIYQIKTKSVATGKWWRRIANYWMHCFKWKRRIDLTHTHTFFLFVHNTLSPQSQINTNQYKQTQAFSVVIEKSSIIIISIDRLCDCNKLWNEKTEQFSERIKPFLIFFTIFRHIAFVVFRPAKRISTLWIIIKKVQLKIQYSVVQRGGWVCECVCVCVVNFSHKLRNAIKQHEWISVKINITLTRCSNLKIQHTLSFIVFFFCVFWFLWCVSVF
jgi:hypothetical protein